MPTAILVNDLSDGEDVVIKAINGVLEATTNNMPELTEGTNVGTWVFTHNKWPKINLPDIVTSVLDLEMVESDRPKGFID